MKLEVRYGITSEIKEGHEPFEKLLPKVIAAIELMAAAAKGKGRIRNSVGRGGEPKKNKGRNSRAKE